MKKSKKFFVHLLIFIMLPILTACGNSDSQTTDTTAVQSNDGNQTQTAEASDKSGNKILIAYFAVAENSEVDAVSSASVASVNGEAKGMVRVLAEAIQSETGGDLFSIQTSVDYPGDINDLIDYAADDITKWLRGLGY